MPVMPTPSSEPREYQGLWVYVQNAVVVHEQIQASLAVGSGVQGDRVMAAMNYQVVKLKILTADLPGLIP
jgi:hypothetical protein